MPRIHWLIRVSWVSLAKEATFSFRLQRYPTTRLREVRRLMVDIEIIEHESHGAAFLSSGSGEQETAGERKLGR